ncbi:hypothetical protein BJY00DRAFT_9257 [Aspergillus carlsbadensis]|nr:hypothetical protein BJY00DRAFT_9257 [Aspergillus carlsbadensis]
MIGSLRLVAFSLLKCSTPRSYDANWEDRDPIASKSAIFRAVLSSDVAMVTVEAAIGLIQGATLAWQTYCQVADAPNDINTVLTQVELRLVRLQGWITYIQDGFLNEQQLETITSILPKLRSEIDKMIKDIQSLKEEATKGFYNKGKWNLNSGLVIKVFAVRARRMTRRTMSHRPNTRATMIPFLPIPRPQTAWANLRPQIVAHLRLSLMSLNHRPISSPTMPRRAWPRPPKQVSQSIRENIPRI